jgi:hypothetical protein
MEHRPSILRSAWLACGWAKDEGAIVLGWAAIPRILRRNPLPLEFEDLKLVAKASEVEAQMRTPNLSLSMLRLNHLVKLGHLVAWGLLSPRKLTEIRWDGLDIGQAIIDSQRRRTMAMDGSRFVGRRIKNEGYPVLPVSENFFVRLAALNIFRFILRAWILKIYWADFLNRNTVVCSCQLHFERAEYGLLTAMLSQKKIPIVSLEHVDRARIYDPFGSLIGNSRLKRFDLLDSSSKSQILTMVALDLENQLLHNQPNVFRTRTAGFVRAEESIFLFDQRFDEALQASKGRCFLLILTAPHEAFNHGRGQSIFFSYTKLFASLARVGLQLGQIPIAVKMHPQSAPSEVQSARRWFAKRKRHYSNTHLLPTGVSLTDLTQKSVRWHAISTESSAVIECMFLRIPVKIAEPTPYRNWKDYKESSSRQEFETSLLEEFLNPSFPKIELTLKISWLTDYGLQYFDVPNLLCSPDVKHYRLPDTNHMITKLCNVYSNSSSSLVLRDETLRDLTHAQKSVVSGLRAQWAEGLSIS